MPRRRRLRWVTNRPPADYYKPRGIPLSMLEETVLHLEEFEALRLSDIEGLEQEQAAQKMKISRPTFGRVLKEARKKVAQAIVSGQALRIEGGVNNFSKMPGFFMRGGFRRRFRGGY